MRDRISWITLIIWQSALLAKGGADQHVKKIGKIGRKYTGGRLRYLLPLAAFAAGVPFFWSCGFFQDGGKPVFKTYDGQWQSIRINNAIVKFIIEQGYGYTVEAVEMTSHEMQEAMETGEINLNMEMWQQSRMGWYNKQIEKGNIINLGMSFEAGPQFFMVPKWVAEQHHIETIFDMEQHWDEASVYYLKNNEDRWKRWVTPKAYKRIGKALKQHLKSSVSDVANLRS